MSNEDEDETYGGIYTDNWEPEESTVFRESDLTPNTTINTDLISEKTVSVCPKCGGRNRLTNEKCVRCDYNLI